MDGPDEAPLFRSTAGEEEVGGNPWSTQSRINISDTETLAVRPILGSLKGDARGRLLEFRIGEIGHI